MNSVSYLQGKGFASLHHEEKLKIKELGRPLPDLNIVQSVKIPKRQFNRVFKRDIYNFNDWICGCEVRNALFCFPCLLFGGEKSWTKIGVTDLNHLTTRIKNHECSTSHLTNVLKLIFLGNGNQQLDSAYEKIPEDKESVTRNRYMLNVIINCIRLCCAFELVSRSTNEIESFSNSNVFEGLINLNAEINDFFKIQLGKSTVLKGMSKNIQIELLQVMLEVCHDEIRTEIKEADFVAFMTVEASNISNMSPVAIVYRFILKGKVVERFWNFISLPQNDRETLASCVLAELDSENLNQHINSGKLVVQTHDRATDMSGFSGCVQAITKERFPNAEYMHRYAHEMNMVVSKAASVTRNVRVFFANLQDVCTFFASRPKKTAVLDSIVKKRLPLANNICWIFLSKNVNTAFSHKEDIIQCINKILEINEEKNSNTLHQAHGLKRMLISDHFNFWLFFFNDIMHRVEILFSELQHRGIYISSAQKSLSDFEKDIEVTKEKLDYSTKETDHSNITLKRKKSGKTEWIREAKEICDGIICETKSRFTFSGHLMAETLFTAEKFPQYSSKFPKGIVEKLCSIYPFLDKVKLSHELSTIYLTQELRSISGATGMLDFLVQNNLEKTFSESSKLLKFILTIPMSSSQKKRFSTLKRIKKFLHYAMPQERLSARAMLSIEKKLIKEMPDFNQRVIDKFVQRKGKV